MTFRYEIAAMMVSKSDSEALKEAWGAWFDRCASKINRDTKIRWMLTNSKPEQWKEIFEEGALSKKDVARLNTISQIRLQRLKQIKTLRSIIEKILNFKTSGDVARDGLRLQEAKRNLKILPQGMLKQFGQLLLAKETKNHSALKRLMEEVIHWEYRVIPFYGVDIPLSNETWASVDSLLLDATKSIDDAVLLRAFATRVFQFVDVSKLPNFASKVDINWSLNELRQFSSSAWYAPRYPAFWFGQMSSRVTQSEIGALIDSLLEREPANDWKNHDLWIFSQWLPGNEKYRTQIVAAITKLRDENEPYLKELVVRLCDNAILRRDLEKNGVIATKALFKLKRDFYLKLIEEGAQVDYALYQLTSMGDEDRSYLWWYALNPIRN